ncbi:YciY family protein [Biostraticola tofi]|uniref:YciY family protein n=1 Tax=Biostraticola tofi TaxID=466109 RepID=UPI001049241D|nr:YciY family protein [Biostraticola tofi]
MKRSRNEVSRWRMQRQAQRRRRQWVESQSRTYRHLTRISHLQSKQQRRCLLFSTAFGC